MNYFILKAKIRGTTTEGQPWESSGYRCANGITRFKDKEGKDWTLFICSNLPTVLPTEDIICIAPTTPPPNWS